MLVPRAAVQRFVILFPGRAGGTYLASALGAHPEVSVKTEPLGLLAERGAPAQAEWIRRRYRPPALGRRRAIGFTTKVQDLRDPEGVAELLHAARARVVLLDRRNDVKRAVSIVRARRLKDTTGRWNRFSPDLELGAIEVDPAELARHLESGRTRRAETAAFVATLDLPVLRVDYEELLVEPGATFARVFEFLGVAPAPVEGATFKDTSDDLRLAVLNFDDLRGHYVGTEYEAMFDEVLTA